VSVLRRLAREYGNKKVYKKTRKVAWSCGLANSPYQAINVGRWWAYLSALAHRNPHNFLFCESQSPAFNLHPPFYLRHHEDYLEGYPTGAHLSGVSGYCPESDPATSAHSNSCRISNQQNQKYEANFLLLRTLKTDR
jgi:hypothetical protein